MAQTETINILRIDGTQAVTTLRQLKEEIEKDKDALVALGLVEDSDVNKKQQQDAITAKLNNDLKLLNQVMQAGKTTTLAAAKATSVSTASYYEMQKALTTLKKAWKDLSAEERQNAEGVEILNKIKQLDAQLKTLDSDIGQFQRNVGNYGQSFKQSLEEAQKGAMGLMQGAQALSGMLALNADQTAAWQKAIVGLQTAVLVVSSVKGIGGLINKLREYFTTSKAATAATEAQTAAMTAEATATATATAATKAFRAALISTGIGAIVVALGALIANLDSVAEWLGIVDKRSRETFDQMKRDLEETNQLWKDKLDLMKATGSVQEAVTLKEIQSLQELVYHYRELEAEAIRTFGSTSDEAKDAAAKVEEATSKLTQTVHTAAVNLQALLDNADMKKAQKGMTEYEKAVAEVNARFDAMVYIASTVDGIIQKITGHSSSLVDIWARLDQARQDALDELAEKERKAAAARVKTEKDAAQKIADDAALALKTEEERLTLKYQEDLAKLEKFHIDSTALTAKYQADLKAIRDKADAAERAAADERQAFLDKQAEENYQREVAANKKASEAKLTQLEQDAEAEAQRAQYTIDNEEELANRTYEIEMASYQARLEALQAFVEQANAINDTETALQYQQEAADLSVQIELRALEEKQRIRERDKKNQQASAKQIVSSSSTIFGAMAEIYEANGNEDAKAQKKAKNLRIAGATIDMFQGAVTAYSTAQSLGPIAGPIVGAINAAAVIAAGTANIAKIKAQDVSGSGDSSAGAATATVEAPSVEPVVNQVRTVTSASEEDRLNSMAKDQRVYILSSDIEADQQQKRVQVAESTF